MIKIEPGKHYYSDNEIGKLSEERDNLAMKLFDRKRDRMFLLGIPSSTYIEGEEEINKKCVEIELKIKELQKQIIENEK